MQRHSRPARRDVPPLDTARVPRVSGPALLLFCSGAAALIYQLLWIKQLSLVVGVDVFAITIAVSAFFAGLAGGSALFGLRADTLDRPLRLYAWLEAGVAVSGVAVTIALAHAARFFVALEARVDLLAWVLPFALIGVPALLMGGTLPAVVRACAPSEPHVARAGGWLYAANTAGAIAGALATPFVLLPWLGVRGSALAAAALNVSAAVGAFAFDVVRRGAQEPPSPSQPSRVAAQDDRASRLALVLYAVSGGIALGYEVIWSHVTVELMSTRAFAFAVVLATYLTGLALGSAAYARIADRVRDTWGAFGVLIAAAGFVALLEIALLGPWLMTWQSNLEEALRAATGNELAAMCGRFAVAALGVVFVPTLLLGAAFPAVLRLTVGARSTGRDVGRVLALNTAGGIAGTLLTGFVALPGLGIVRSLGLLALGALAVGAGAVLGGSGGTRLTRRTIGALGVATIVTAVLTPEDRLARLLTSTRSGGQLVFYAESPGGTAAVVEQQTRSGPSRRLYIRGVSNSGDTLTSLRYMRLQSLLPLIVHRGEPRSALVIGLGTGITAGALRAWPGLEHRVCVELLPAVVQAAPLFRGNFDAASTPEIEIRVRDGRRELLRSEARYDLITLEPPPPSAAGVVNLYSRDFYQLARSRLNADGLLAQWWPLPTQNDEDSRAMVRSFLDAFPHASAWTTELHEMLLLGSPDPIELDAVRMTRLFDRLSVASTLREVGIASAAGLAATWIMGRQELERYAGATPAVTDDRPAIEYATWVRRGEIARVLPALLALRTDPPVVHADAAFLAEMNAERQRLLRFYDAALYAYRGERDKWAEALRDVIDGASRNAYYSWLAGESR